MRLLTNIEAAKAMRVSPRTLLTMRQRGLVPWIRIGKRIVFELDSLSRAIGKLEIKEKV